MAIPVFLILIVKMRKDVPFNWIFWMFAAFIIGCGMTHFSAALMTVFPAYYLDAIIKILTAAVSWGTVYLLVRLFPEIMALKSPEQLQHLNEELRRTNEELETQRLRFENAFHNAYAAKIIADDTGRVVSVNEAASRVFGYSTEKMLQSHVTDYIPPEYRDAHLSSFSRFVRTSESNLIGKTLELYALHKNGERFPVDITIGAWKENKRWMFLATMRDNTERHAAEQTIKSQWSLLQHNNEIMQSVLDDMAEGVIAADHQGKFLLLNSAAKQILGMQNLANGWSTTCSTYYVGGNKHESCDLPLERAIKGESVDNCSLMVRRPDKDVILEVTARPTKTGGIAVFRDVTAQKQVEESLKRSNEELEQFAYVASHDLQEPLRMVSSYCKLLERRYKGKLDADADEFIHYAVDGATRMQSLINDLLQLSRITTRQQEFKEIDVNQVIKKCLLDIRDVSENAKFEVTELPTIRCDEGQIHQVFQNLISNGLKFTRDGVTPVIKIGASLEGGNWLFYVSDNGIGIKKEHADRIFIIFQRLHTKGKYPGTGIGLAICKKIVGRHGGRIWVESEPDVGSTFFFTVPAKETNESG